MAFFDPNYFDHAYFDADLPELTLTSGGVGGASASVMLGIKARSNAGSNNIAQLYPQYSLSLITEATSNTITLISPYYNVDLKSTASSTTLLSIETVELDFERFGNSEHISIGDHVLLFNRRKGC